MCSRVLLERALGRVDQPVGLVAQVGQLRGALVGVGCCSAASATSRSISPCVRPPDAVTRIACAPAGAEILRRDVDDAVGVDLEASPRSAARRAAPAGCRPARSGRGVLLSAAISRSPCSTWMRTTVWLSSVVEKTWLFAVGMVVLLSMILRGDAALRLDAERERRDVEQQHVLDLALQHAALDRRADRDDLVGVHALVRLLAEDLRDLLAARAACASCRRPGSPRRSRSRRSPASSSAVSQGSTRRVDQVGDERLELARA